MPPAERVFATEALLTPAAVASGDPSDDRALRHPGRPLPAETPARDFQVHPLCSQLGPTESDSAAGCQKHVSRASTCLIPVCNIRISESRVAPDWLAVPGRSSPQQVWQAVSRALAPPIASLSAAKWKQMEIIACLQGLVLISLSGRSTDKKYS